MSYKIILCCIIFDFCSEFAVVCHAARKKYKCDKKMVVFLDKLMYFLGFVEDANFSLPVRSAAVVTHSRENDVIYLNPINLVANLFIPAWESINWYFPTDFLYISWEYRVFCELKDFNDSEDAVLQLEFVFPYHGYSKANVSDFNNVIGLAVSPKYIHNEGQFFVPRTVPVSYNFQVDFQTGKFKDPSTPSVSGCYVEEFQPDLVDVFIVRQGNYLGRPRYVVRTFVNTVISGDGVDGISCSRWIPNFYNS